ncbi:hypothetical protein [Haladaptatus sp. DFWS20]|uniref:hypothetical protein n=1 Tax=Haladaptatus sp. DFWS20 TaxID=3403467 RepID=UPI003EBF5466
MTLWTDRVRPDTLSHLARRTTASSDGDAIPVSAPFTGERIGSVPACTESDVEVVS